MKKKSINYNKLFKHLLDNTELTLKDIKVPHDEYSSVVSHYLQSKGKHAVYGGKTLFETYDKEVQAFAGISEAVNKYQILSQLSLDFKNIPYPSSSKPEFTFIDLFAGIGGFRIALQELGGKCVFSCEWDKYAKKTYEANFGETPFGDVRQFTDPEKISDNKLNRMIPDHDILVAGFPCQPFSIAGVSKKKSLGRKHGFDDPTQGTLFFDIKRILQVKKPAAFFLENVKNLLTHDQRRTFEIIKKSLKEDLGYIINYKVVDGAKWVPQHRERIYIVGYNPSKISISENDIIIPTAPANGYKKLELKNIIIKKVEDRYTLGPGTWETLRRHKEYHAGAGNGFGYGLINMPVKKGTITRTISARYHKDGAEILIEQRNKRPRKLTPEEAMQLMGLDPNKFEFPVSDTQAYRQIGNSVIVPAVKDTAKEIVKVLTSKSR